MLRSNTSGSVGTANAVILNKQKIAAKRTMFLIWNIIGRVAVNL
jgi:hypothetical protein